MAEPLTPVERKVYQYLIDFLAENTYQPSIREIGKRFRIKSTKTVSDLLQSLTSKGYIERDPARSRGVRILGYQGPSGVQPLPVYGAIHAGEPTLQAEHRTGYLSIDRRFVPGEDTFALRVKGDSMIGRGIHDGDYVLVHPSSAARDGDIVAARLGSDSTIKTIDSRDGRTVLVPAHPDERELVIDEATDFAVLGVVCGVFRPMFDREQFGQSFAAAPTISS
ncbi:MAG TPA: transcriptional repressor LexA [Gemmatirosa sp.]|nr:transcriptional repressor LexA [Gemmatirosa sp.]